MPFTQSKLIRMIVLAGLTSLYHSHWAHAIPATWGNLPTNSGPSIYDWEVQNWINEFFEDGSRNNGTVDSNIAMYYTQCYGGDWLENFNNILREPVEIGRASCRERV